MNLGNRRLDDSDKEKILKQLQSIDEMDLSVSPETVRLLKETDMVACNILPKKRGEDNG